MSARLSLRVTTLAATVLLGCAALSSYAAAQTAEWNALVAAAQKEGKVAVMAPPDQSVREALPAVFKARFGITMDYIGGRSGETASKLLAERQAGIYTIDAALSGIQTMANIFYDGKMLDPLPPVLIAPEVLDLSKWKSGKLWYMDPEQKYVLRLFNTLGALFHINSKMMKPEDLQLARGLLDEKWKGKIVMSDPTVAGTGSNDATRLYVQFGEEFVRKLYIDQKPVIIRDRRQVSDFLARGAYPIAFGAEDDQMDLYEKDGLPVKPIYSLPDLPGQLGAGVGEVALFNHAPHPNAAKLFVNWIASKEGLETFARTRRAATTRNDIDEASFLPAEFIPKPGVEYFDSYGWDYSLTTKEKARLMMKDILRR